MTTFPESQTDNKKLAILLREGYGVDCLNTSGVFWRIGDCATERCHRLRFPIQDTLCPELSEWERGDG